MSQLLKDLESKWTPWAQLNTQVPHAEIWNEFRRVWSRVVPHRSSYSHGWYSLTLHGLRSDWTEAAERYPGYEHLNDSTAPYDWTDIVSLCPITHKYLLSLPYRKFDRVRFMLLAPNGFIRPHKDTNKSSLRPLNIAIEHPDGCFFDFFDNNKTNQLLCTVPFKTGTGFFVNIGLTHQFRNLSNRWRLHIIVHGATDKSFDEDSGNHLMEYYR
jgi:hypothetical protein